MIAAATNCITRAEDKLATMISESAMFQTWTGEANAVGAKARVYVDALPEPWQMPGKTLADGREYDTAGWSDLFPIALIEQPDQGNQVTLNVRSHGTAWEYTPDYLLGVSFIRFRDVAEGLQEEIRSMRNSIGTVIEEVAGQSGAGDTFSFSRAYNESQVFELEESYTEMLGLGRLIGWKWAFERTTQ